MGWNAAWESRWTPVYCKTPSEFDDGRRPCNPGCAGATLGFGCKMPSAFMGLPRPGMRLVLDAFSSLTLYLN